jgi:carbon monoxide dehydrogenase subunit G
MQYSITTEIDAPPDVVYAVLIDVERWPEWTPTVTRVERLGDAGAPFALGTRVRIIQPKVPPAEWTVTAIEAGRGFRYVSRSPGATVEANHWIEPVEAGERSRVTLSVTFDGFLGRLIGRMMRGLNERYIAQEAAGLKQRSEARARETRASASHS